jgi:uncharacterized protein YggT (Ycf19 family)
METVISLLDTFFTIYLICIFAWALMSWLPQISPGLAYNSTVVSIRRFLDSVVLPYVKLFRFIPPIRAGGTMIDLSALVAMFALIIVGPILLNVLASVAGVS